MNKVAGLADALKNIDGLSTKMITKAMKIMKDLETEESEILEEFLEERPESDQDDALEFLQNLSLGLVADAETVKKEIDAFSDTVVQGEDALDEGEEEYPFLFQVWRGDIYNASEVEGLKSLIADLKEQLSGINEERFIERALEMEW